MIKAITVLVASICLSIALMSTANAVPATPGTLLATFTESVSFFAPNPVNAEIYATTPTGVLVINPATKQIVTKITLSNSPKGLAVSADGTRLYVATSTATQLAVINTATRAVLNYITLPCAPYDVAVGNSGRIYATPSSTGVCNSIMQIDTTTDTYTKELSSDALILHDGLLAISPDRNTLYFANSGVSPGTLAKFDVSTNTATQTYKKDQFGGNGQDLFLTPAGDYIYYVNLVGNISYDIVRIRTSDMSFQGSLITGAFPRTLITNSDETLAYTVHTSGYIDVWNTLTQQLVTQYSVNDQASKLAIDDTNQYLLAAFPNELRIYSAGVPSTTPTPTATPIPTPVTISAGSLLAVFPETVSFFAQNPNNAEIYATTPTGVLVINPTTRQILARIPVYGLPKGLAVSADGTLLYVATSTAMHLAVIDIATRTLQDYIPLPYLPYHVAVGNGGRLYITSSSNESFSHGILQIDVATKTITQEFSGNPNVISVDGLLTTSPDRNTLYFATRYGSPSTLVKFDISTSTPSQLYQNPFGTLGGNGEDLFLSPVGDYIYYCVGSGNTSYDISRIRTSDMSAQGALATGPYPETLITTANGNTAYTVHTDGYIDVWNTQTQQLTDQYAVNGHVVKLAIDDTDHYLLAAFSTELRIYAANTYPKSTPTPSPTPTIITTPTPVYTPTVTPMPSPTGTPLTPIPGATNKVSFPLSPLLSSSGTLDASGDTSNITEHGPSGRRIATNNAGLFLHVNNEMGNIYGQYVENGFASGFKFLIAMGATYADQQEISVDMNNAGVAVVGWNNNGTIKAQIIPANTSILTPNPVTVGSGDGVALSASIDESGNIGVTWSNGKNLYLKTFDNTGNAISGSVLVSANCAISTLLQQILFNGVLLPATCTAHSAMNDNGLVVVWNEENHVYAHRLNVNAVSAGSIFQIDDTPADVGALDPEHDTAQIFGTFGPVIAMDDANNFAVAWHRITDNAQRVGTYQWNHNINFGIVSQHFDVANQPSKKDSLGNPVDFVIALDKTKNTNPEISLNDEHNFAIVWQNEINKKLRVCVSYQDLRDCQKIVLPLVSMKLGVFSASSSGIKKSSIKIVTKGVNISPDTNWVSANGMTNASVSIDNSGDIETQWVLEQLNFNYIFTSPYDYYVNYQINNTIMSRYYPN